MQAADESSQDQRLETAGVSRQTFDSVALQSSPLARLHGIAGSRSCGSLLPMACWDRVTDLLISTQSLHWFDDDVGRIGRVAGWFRATGYPNDRLRRPTSSILRLIKSPSRSSSMLSITVSRIRCGSPSMLTRICPIFHRSPSSIR